MAAELRDGGDFVPADPTPPPPGGVPMESEQDKSWVAYARAAHRSSTDWFDASIRRKVEEAYSNFRSEHPAGSKYNTPYYQKRSRLFRPKTRTIVRKSEAALAVALFSTSDVVHCTPYSDANEKQLLAAEVHNSLLNARLEETETLWFLTVLGGAQDAFTAGVVISRQTWEYESEILTEEGRKIEVVTKDRPRIDLVALENFRVSPTADWRDPVNTSPYVIELRPMYVYEIKERMKKQGPDGKPLYRQIPDDLLRAGAKQDWDTIRRAREGNTRIDRYDAKDLVSDYETVWVHHNIVRRDGRDYVFDTIGTELMLSTEAKPLQDVYHHGIRPYAMGFSVIEAHKPYPSSPAMLTASMQEETNDLTNLRIDNIRLALGKRWIVKRGAGVDTTTLVRGVHSSVTMANNPAQDVRELVTQDVTNGSYQEQDRLNLDMDELAGNFGQGTVGTARNLNETVGGMSLMDANASQVQEYQIRTLVETWVTSVLQQFQLLSAEYETDQERLQTIATENGVDVRQVVGVLRERVRVRTNVGFNSTTPEKRVQKITLGLQALATFYPQVVQQGNVAEIAKEIFGALGFKDASRFLPGLKKNGQEDPRITQLQQQVDQLTQMLQTQMYKEQTKLQVAQIGSNTALQVANIKAQIEAMKVSSGNDMEMFLAQLNNRLEEVDRMLEAENVDIRRRELYLQREALSHTISESNRRYAMEVAGTQRENTNAQGGPGKKGGGKPEGPMDLPGNDKAGTLARDRYGALPDSILENPP